MISRLAIESEACISVFIGFYINFFILSIAIATRQHAIDIARTIQNPNGDDWNGRFITFIPHKLAISVGIDSTIVSDVRIFITMLRLFEITEANASIVPLKMLR